MDDVDVVGGTRERHEEVSDAVVHDLGGFDEDDSVEFEALGGNGRQEGDTLGERSLAGHVGSTRSGALVADNDGDAATGGARLAVEALLGFALGLGDGAP